MSTIKEIVKGRNKFKLGDRISEITRTLVTGTITIEDFALVSSCCSSILNRHLFSAGWAFADESEKPILPKEKRPIFSNASQVRTNVSVDNYVANKQEKGFFNEWALGCKQLYTENVKYEYDIQPANCQ